MTDQENFRSLDEIMSREPVTETVQEPNTPAQPETVEQGQPRDDAGKFAPKAENAAGADGDADKAAQAAVEGGDGKGKVPLQAVQAERDKRKEAQSEAEALRREVAELRGQVSVLSRQPAQPQTPAEKPKPKSFWESPDEFLAERTAPIQQEAITRHFMTSRMLAEDKFGAERVKEADDAIGALMQANPNDPEIIAMQQRIQNSPHPYRDLVTWHDRRKALAEIGEDPAAYRERLRQELLAELQPAAQPAPTQQQPAAKAPMPTNFAGARSEGPRTGVTYTGPKPLSEIVKGSAQ